MANLAKIKDIIISSGGNYTIETLSNYQELNMSYSAFVINSNVVLNPATNIIGTVKGLTFKIHYDGSLVTFNNSTVSIFGTTMNNNLRNQKLIIDLFYDGLNWIVIFTPSYNTIVGLLNSSNIVYSYHNGLATLNSAGPQTLLSFTLPKSLFQAGDRYIFKISGRYNGATSKGIEIAVNDGTTNFNVWNQSVTFNNKDFYIESTFICTNFSSAGSYSTFQSQLSTFEYPNIISSGSASFPPIDFTTNWTISIIGREFTPTGNQINIHNITVEKLLK